MTIERNNSNDIIKGKLSNLKLVSIAGIAESKMRKIRTYTNRLSEST